MNLSTGSFFPLARTMMSDLSLQYHEEPVPVGWGNTLWIVAAIVVVILAAAAFWFYRQQDRSASEPGGLLMELCRAHRLNRSSRQILHRITSAAELKQPAVMLVSPDLFEATVSRVTKKQPLSSKEQRCLDQLRHRLFAIG